MHAFRAAIEGFPQAYDMYMEVVQSIPETEDRTRPNRTLFSAHDAIQEPPQLEWCVQDLFAQPSLNVLVGDPGSKKTLLAIDLAVSVALGKPWLHRPVNPCPVLI